MLCIEPATDKRYGALLGRVLVAAVITMPAREDRWCVLFIETIKEALHAIKHASVHPFLIGFKRQTLEHSAINLCSKILCHMKWTTSHIAHISHTRLQIHHPHNRKYYLKLCSVKNYLDWRWKLTAGSLMPFTRDTGSRGVSCCGGIHPCNAENVGVYIIFQYCAFYLFDSAPI